MANAEISVITSANGVDICADIPQMGSTSLFVSDVTTRCQFVDGLKRLLNKIISDRVSPSEEIIENLNTAIGMAQRAVAWRLEHGGAWYRHDDVIADAFVGLGST